jgi:ribonuclease HI
VLESRGKRREVKGAEALTTNNRMELTAAIEGLRALRRRCRVTIVTDSEYLRRGMTEWLPAWRRRGWRTAARKPVKNVELWQDLEAMVAFHDVAWRWVRGHSGDAGNERADALANEAIDEMLGRVPTAAGPLA